MEWLIWGAIIFSFGPETWNKQVYPKPILEEIKL